LSGDFKIGAWVKDKLFSKDRDGEEKALPLPDGFTAEDIRVEASICTGEKTIGFYDKESKRLKFAELVYTDEDIAQFYKKYGINK